MRAAEDRLNDDKQALAIGGFPTDPSTVRDVDRDLSQCLIAATACAGKAADTTFTEIVTSTGARHLLTTADYVALLRVDQGSVRVCNDDVWDDLEAHQCGLFISNRTIEVETTNGEPTRISVCSVPRLASAVFRATTRTSSVAHTPRTDCIHTLLTLGRALTGSNAPADVRLRDVIGDAIFRAFIVEAGAKQMATIPQMVEKARSYIDTHFADPLDLTRIADKAGVRKEHLVTAFRKSFGITPMRYVKERRTLEAVQLVRETSLTLVEVAQVTGYKSEFHLSREIKRMVGTTPRGIRKNKTS